MGPLTEKLAVRRSEFALNFLPGQLFVHCSQIAPPLPAWVRTWVLGARPTSGLQPDRALLFHFRRVNDRVIAPALVCAEAQLLASTVVLVRLHCGWGNWDVCMRDEWRSPGGLSLEIRGRVPGAGHSFFCFDLRSKSVPRERRSLRDVARCASKKLDSRFLVASLELPRNQSCGRRTK